MVVKLYDYVTFNVHQDARKFMGQFMTVSKLSKVAGCYFEEDNSRWIWDESLFERVATTEEAFSHHWQGILRATEKK